jgi:hypothetical protein
MNMNMTKNVGRIDRAIRFAVGLALVVWGLLSPSWLGAIGLIPIATAAMSWCPAYSLVGISTCKTGN